jgi:phosphoribosyl 1,2-cyclic phosphodiesterase
MTDEIRVQSLGSGSSGNLLLVESAGGLTIVDCGLGPRRLPGALAAAGRTLDDVQNILLTHEHGDHAGGLAAFRQREVSIVCTAGTARAAGVPAALHVAISAGAPTSVGSLTVRSFVVSHDAAEPCGFQIEVAGVRIALLTDLGVPDDLLRSAIAGTDLVVLEANHDVDLLRSGPYPVHLKRRVLSATGHLSNDDCADLLLASLQGAERQPAIWLAHLSETNNRPELALSTVRQRFARAGLAAAIEVLPRRRPGPIWTPRRASQPSIQMTMPGF